MVRDNMLPLREATSVMENINAEANYKSYSNSPDRVDGAVHNTAHIRKGVSYDYKNGETLPSVEFAFSRNGVAMRSMIVVDMDAARAMRDRLDAILNAA